MPAITGVRTTRGANQINQERRPEDFADEINNVEAGYKNNEAAFLALTTNISKKREVTNPKYSVLEDVYRPREGTLNGALAAGNETTITVTTPFGDYCRAGTILFIPETLELIRVGAAASATSLTGCTRNYGTNGLPNKPTGVGATTDEGDGPALAGTEVIVRVNDIFAEGTDAPDAITILTEESYNLIEIVKTSVDLSGTLIASDLYGEANDEEYQIKKKAIEHKIDCNRSLWLSRRRIGTATAGAERKTSGILQHIQGNRTTVSNGTVTMKVLDAFAEKVFENGSDTKYLFGSMAFASALDSLSRNVVRVDSGAESFGTNMKEIITNKGRFMFVLEKKVFYGDLVGLVPCLDLEYIRYCFLRGRDTRLYRNIKTIEQNDGYDGKKHLWQTDMGLDMRGYSLSHSLAASTGSQRSVHGQLDFGTSITY